MPELWFLAGLAMGVAITGFCAIGSFDRGADSVRRKTWVEELAARQRAVIASQSREEALVARRNAPQVVINEFDRVRRAIARRLATGGPDQGRGLVRRADLG
jgi:hypothetical protein